MEDSLCQKNIFKCGFDSFEIDDGFLLEMDAEVKKRKDVGSGNDEKEKATNYFSSSLNFEDLNDSDFLNSNVRPDTEIYSKTSQHLNMKLKRGNEKLSGNAFKISCLSPIQSAVPLNKRNQSFSSTPIRKEKKEAEENAKNTNYNYTDADLFEDWDIVDFNLEERKKDEDDFITMSQAFQMIDEAKQSRDEKNHLNESFSMLTGEILQTQDELHSNGKDKPTAAQKLNFETDIDPVRIVDDSDLGNICLSSDEDFDAFTHIISVKANAQKGSKKHNTIELSDDSMDYNTKKGKKIRIIESDTTEDSPSPKFRRRFKKKNSNGSQGRQFLDTEAEVSDEAEVSIDEVDHEGDEYEKSFVVEGSYFTQNCSADMTAKYLESVKTIAGRPNGFKIPKAKPYVPDNVFSQMPEEPNTDYELDSFCVNDVEEETKTDLSELEIAEKVLEMDRKKKKQKRGRSQVKRVK